MRADVKQYGQGVAIPIPREIAEKAGLKPDTPVEVSLVDGKLLVSTIGQSLPALDELLSNVTEGNLHREIDTGVSVGTLHLLRPAT